MKTYEIKSLKKSASAIGLGTMIFHPDTQKRDFSLLNTYVENGGTYIDTAEVYGAVEEYGYSEMVIGSWLKANASMREKIILASKGLIPGYCAPLHPGGAKIDPPSIQRAITGSLQRLHTDYLDIWMFHRDNSDIPVDELVDTLDEEVRKGRIRAYGASNWSTSRIQAAIDYAKHQGKAEMMSASNHFSLAKAKEPFWDGAIVTDESDKKWFIKNHCLLVAWSSLGRGFFAKGNPSDTSNKDLVRVYYSEENFERKKRAEEFGKMRGLSMFEIALAYVISQDFQVIALNGSETPEQVLSSIHASELSLSPAERDWLDLTSNEKLF